jgi:NitT/TauT family transport system ATP-binding protein
MDNAGPQIRISDVSHYSGAGANRKPVFGPISVDILKGEFFSILGPSLCGKTALLKMIAGLTAVETGEITHTELHKGTRGGVGAVLQDPALLPWRTAMENILMTAEIQGLDPDESCLRARRLLAWFGLSQCEKRRTCDLPESSARAIAICRALAESPRLLLLDEPFGGLEPLAREKIADTFQRLWLESGTTTVLCTTNIQEAVMLSDRIAVLSARPARIIETLEIDLPRPRRLNKSMSPQITEYCSRIRTLFRAQGVLP